MAYASSQQGAATDCVGGLEQVDEQVDCEGVRRARAWTYSKPWPGGTHVGILYYVCQVACCMSHAESWTAISVDVYSQATPWH